METKILILGKGDNIITMILDNLYSTLNLKAIVVYNNLYLSFTPSQRVRWAAPTRTGQRKMS